MIFKKLILNNVGPYEGLNHFDLNINEQQNTILIGGKNGAGKTTFLNAVRLALYGPVSYGFKTESKDYLNKVKDLLNNNAANAAHNNFHIQIDFSLIEDFQSVDISLIRSWEDTGRSIKEKVEIKKNNSPLNEVEKDEFFERLRTKFPPSLLELCFFDGEDISNLSNEDRLSTYLKDLSTKLFNLDLFQSLEKDLEEYVSQSFDSNKDKNLEHEKEKTRLELYNKTEEQRDLFQKIEKTSVKTAEAKDKYAATKNEFSLHGGLAYEEREKLQNEIASLENERKHTSERIREFIANDLPFFIALPRLKKLVEQLKKEEDYYVATVLKEKIEQLSLSEIIKELDIQASHDKEKKLKEKLVDNLADTEEINIIHNASKTEAHQVYNLLSNTNKDNLANIDQLIKQNQVDLNKLQSLKRKLKDNESSSEFNEMITLMEEYNEEIVKGEKDLEVMSSEAKILSEEISVLNNKYEKQKSELYNLYKSKSSYHDSLKILNISKKFQSDQLRKKIKDVEYFSSKMIRELLCKELFINHIKLDPSTFEITLLDHNHTEINKTTLSAGEQELLVLSIIWGTITSSKKQLPFVMDTLLGRLDLEHKHSVVTKLIPKFGEQIIILSTDSEINNHLYDNLRPFISNEYTLNYKTDKQRTEIEPLFFDDKIRKVVN